MKTFFVSLLILIIAAGVVFYFGWVQIEIPPDHAAVIFTKTGGFDEKPVKPGEFMWRWEKLFPTNMTIYTFPLTTRSKEIRLEGSLPSAEEYAAILPIVSSFSYKIVLTLTYSLNPEQLPNLVQSGRISADSPEKVFESFEQEAAGIVSRHLVTSLQQQRQFYDILPDIDEALQSAFPYLQIYPIATTEVEFPDFDLYLAAKEAYIALVESENSILVEETERAAKALASTEQRISLLRQYGELLTEYPIILEYLTLGLDQEFLFESLGADEAEY